MKVQDSNIPRYKAAPLGAVLPSAGGPFKQRTSIFGDSKPQEVFPSRSESSVHVVQTQRRVQAQVAMPMVRVMASAVLHRFWTVQEAFRGAGHDHLLCTASGVCRGHRFCGTVAHR